MNANLQKAIELIEKQEIADFFAFLKSQIGTHEMITRLEKVFIWGKNDADFADQLKTLAHNFFVEYPAQNKAYHHEITEKIRNNRKIGTEELLQKKTVEDCEVQTLESFFRNERVIEKTGHEKPNLPHQAFLSLSLAENGHLFKGTFLCLGKANQIYSLSHTAAESKFIYFKGTERKNILILETVTGNLLEQYAKMMMLMRKHIPLGRKRETDEDIYEVPFIAVREFVANAFVHRSYEENVKSTIQIEFFDDRIEIKSPGRLPEDLDLSNIHTSVVINPTVALIFWYAKHIERSATGIMTAQSELKYYGHEPARIEQLQKPDTVRVTIFKNRKNKKNTELEYAYSLIEENRVADFFDWAENFDSNENLEKLRNEFILGKIDSHFKERLKMLAKIIAK